MFKFNDEYFSKVLCPNLQQNHKCCLINCFYSHEDGNQASEKTTSSINNTNKKRSIEQTEDIDEKKEQKEYEKNCDVPAAKKVQVQAPDVISIESKPCPSPIPNKVRESFIKEIAKSQKSSTPNKDAILKEFEVASKSTTSDEYKLEIIKLFGPGFPKDPELVMPKSLPIAPAPIQARKQNILELVKVIKTMEPYTLTPKLRAIEEEFNIASKATNNTYSQTIKRKVYELRNPQKFKPKLKQLSDDDYYYNLIPLVISNETLKKYGYIMEVPEGHAPKMIKTCKRCQKEFNLENQLIPIHCAYHSGKVEKRQRERVYSCCGASFNDNESEPCTSFNHHVFYWDSPEEMHHFLPFKYSKDALPHNPKALKAVGIDCEMGFTTKGFELLRITAVDFFSGKQIIDLLVKPIGQVIDLNSRWSGISEIKSEALEFEQLIKELNEFIDYNTILIGHGLENDLNAMRLIHHKVVDTAILYPKFKTSPTFRYSLKHLVFTFLGKIIQTGQHDSGEDALAAIDIVKHFIKKDLLQ